jgi:hypothetical protein
MAKNGNEWYIISVAPAGVTDDDDRAFAIAMFQNFRSTIQQVAIDIEDTSMAEAAPTVSESVEF